MSEPASQAEYEERYTANLVIGPTQHFPCPFCAAADWYVIARATFDTSTGSIMCSDCGRSAQMLVDTTGFPPLVIYQTAGADPSPWVPIKRPPQELGPGAIAPDEAVGSPTVTADQLLEPFTILSDATVGSPSISGGG